MTSAAVDADPRVAYREWLDALRAAGELIEAAAAPDTPLDRAEGARYLTRLASTALLDVRGARRPHVPDPLHHQPRVPQQALLGLLPDPDLRALARRRFLQLLQWRCPGDRWVLKAPSHLGALDALLAVYPDARIVQTHRDPLRVLASMTSLVCNLIWMRSDRVDPRRVAKLQVRGVQYLLEKSMQQRDEGLVGETQIVDVLYRDLVADPLRVLAPVYAHFDLELRPEVADRMRTYVAARPQGRHGAHRYRFEDTGLDLERERDRFAGYRERFGVAVEI